MVTLTWHACKYKIHKLHQRYISNVLASSPVVSHLLHCNFTVIFMHWRREREKEKKTSLAIFRSFSFLIFCLQQHELRQTSFAVVAQFLFPQVHQWAASGGWPTFPCRWTGQFCWRHPQPLFGDHSGRGCWQGQGRGYQQSWRSQHWGQTGHWGWVSIMVGWLCKVNVLYFRLSYFMCRGFLILTF